MDNVFEKKVYGVMSGGDPMEISALKSWIEEMELAGATHIGCQSYMLAYKVLTDAELIKEQIDRQESELAELKTQYEEISIQPQ